MIAPVPGNQSWIIWVIRLRNPKRTGNMTKTYKVWDNNVYISWNLHNLFMDVTLKQKIITRYISLLVKLARLHSRYWHNPFLRGVMNHFGFLLFDFALAWLFIEIKKVLCGIAYAILVNKLVCNYGSFDNCSICINFRYLSHRSTDTSPHHISSGWRYELSMN